MGMTDREKVMAHLRVIDAYMSFALKRGTCYLGLQAICDIKERADDALALLKEQERYVSVPFSWLVKFCSHIDFKEPLTDEEREKEWKSKLKQQFGIDV